VGFMKKKHAKNGQWFGVSSLTISLVFKKNGE
jgi:hypothetical protein